MKHFCSYCGGAITTGVGRKSHEPCEKEARNFENWVREQPTDATDEICTAIIAAIMRGDKQALRWVRWSVTCGNMDGDRYHVEIADNAATAGLRARDLDGYREFVYDQKAATR